MFIKYFKTQDEKIEEAYMLGRKSKYSEEKVCEKCIKKWSVAGYIRLSQEDGDNGEDKLESNSITSQRRLITK